MSRRLFIAVFERGEDLLAAVRASRARGLKVHEVFTPYPVRGLEEALELKQSRLPWVCLGFALGAAIAMLTFQVWAMTIDWPINVGGKPWNALPAFVPAKFEMMVLAGSVSVFIAFLLASRLFPGKRSRLIVPGVTDDKFALVLEEADASFDPEEIAKMCEGFNVVRVEERLAETEDS
ncbi:MAG: DUF3341 domain-containing protein [bacterium]